MIERGIVERINDDRTVSVMLCPDEACTSCAACAAFDRNKPQVVRNRNPRDLALAPGDFVEIYLAPGRTIRAAALVLILPLVLFFAAYLAAGRWGLSEPLRVGAGATGLAAAFVFNFLRRGSPADLPEIRRIAGSRAGAITA